MGWGTPVRRNEGVSVGKGCSGSRLGVLWEGSENQCSCQMAKTFKGGTSLSGRLFWREGKLEMEKEIACELVMLGRKTFVLVSAP